MIHTGMHSYVNVKLKIILTFKKKTPKILTFGQLPQSLHSRGTRKKSLYLIRMDSPFQRLVTFNPERPHARGLNKIKIKIAVSVKTCFIYLRLEIHLSGYNIKTNRILSSVQTPMEYQSSVKTLTLPL